MALPPKGDPSRPLHLAARSARLLGYVGLILTVLVMALFVVVRRPPGAAGSPAAGTAGGPPSWAVVVGVVMAVLIYGVPSVLYIVFGRYTVKERMWAVIGNIVLCGLTLAVLALSAVGAFVLLIGEGQIFPLLISALFIGAFGQMLYHLIKGLQYLRSRQTPEGFQPIFPSPAPPPPLPVPPA
jgi:hypothetical protein